MRLTVRVPATSANLGPGFDCFGLALDLCNEIQVDTDGTPGVSWEGHGASELPTDGTDLIQATMRTAAGDGALPAFRLQGSNRVPLASGLGSSSAAVVAGLVASLALRGDDPSPERVFALAAPIEGHPDNAAAACFGGFTVAVEGGLVRRLDPHPDVRPVLLVPEHLTVATHGARALLGELVPRVDAVFNVGHAALLVDAIVREPSRLGEAMHDRLHQDARLGSVPAAREVFEAVRASGVPVCISGSGPTLIAFPGPGDEPPVPGPGWRSMPVPVRPRGFELEIH